MTDINKQIEEASWDYLNPDDGDFIDFADQAKVTAFKHGAEWMLKKLKHSPRWRKVSEELPEYGSIIVAKDDTSDFQNMYLIEIDSDYSMSVLTSYYKEWKPID